MKNLRLKSARAAKDLSQEQLADLCGVTRQTIAAIEKGDYIPDRRRACIPQTVSCGSLSGQSSYPPRRPRLRSSASRMRDR